MCYDAFSDEELIAKLRRGENEVTDYILEKYKPLVRKRTNAMYLMGGETEDLIQEGMSGLFKANRDYQEEREASFYHFAELCINRQLYSALQASNRKKHQPLNTYISFSSGGVTGFVGPGSKPVPLTDAEMRPLGIKAENVVVDFAEGDMIVVIGGVWKDTCGVITAMNHNKQTVTINVDLFGRETPVEVSFADVKKMN